MMHQVREVVFVASVDRHLERVDRQVTAQRSRHLPLDDEPTEHVNDERHVDLTGVSLHVSEVRDPETVRHRSHELTVH
jgi:hypothetical protein